MKRASRNDGASVERTPEQRLGVGVAAEAAGELGEHPHRGDVGRVGLEARAEQPLGDRDAAVGERGGGGHQLGIVDRGGDRGAVGGIAPGAVAGGDQAVAARLPLGSWRAPKARLSSRMSREFGRIVELKAGRAAVVSRALAGRPSRQSLPPDSSRDPATVA